MVARADPLFTFRALPLVAARLARCGRDPGPLLAAAGVPDAARDEIIAPLSRLIAFIDAAADAVGDRLFGLSLAEAASSISFGYPVFAARTAPTVRAGLQALCELAALVNPVGRFTLTTTPRSATLDYTVSGQRRGLGCHLNEYTLWLILCIASDAVAGGLPLERAWLPHRRDAETTALLRARLRCPVELDAPSLGIAFAPALLEVQPRLADAGLFAFLSARARHELAAIPSEDVIASVIRVIEPRLDDPRLGLRGVARASRSPSAACSGAWSTRGRRIARSSITCATGGFASSAAPARPGRPPPRSSGSPMPAACAARSPAGTPRDRGAPTGRTFAR